MKIELMPPDALTPYERNPRVNTAAVESVKRSLREYGFRQPIVVDASLTVVAGHTRLTAAKTLVKQEDTPSS